MKALVLSPHPDDMEYSLGGTVIKMLENGWIIDQLIFSDCVEAVGVKFINGAKKSAEQLGVKTNFREFPVHDFMDYRSAIRETIYELRGENYNIIFVPCRQDWHQDHQVVTQETVRIFRKTITVLGYIKKEIFERYHDLRVDLDPKQAKKRLELLSFHFGLIDIEVINPEWFEVIYLRNYL